MKQQLLILFSVFLAIDGFAQIIFEKGYFIDNEGQKVDCLIKNGDWENNPIEFVYKLTEDSEEKKESVKTTQGFGVYNVSKFVSATVDLDRSSETPNKLSRTQEPIFEKEELFLKVLVEGKSTLYQYWDTNLKRYFFSKEDGTIEQLVFKTYLKNISDLAVNQGFKQQLLVELKCPGIEVTRIQSLRYEKKDLMNFFSEFSQCQNQELVFIEKKEKRDLFNLNIRPRINNSSLAITNSVNSFRNNNFRNAIGFGLGLEAEFVLPFQKNKWAVILEPTFNYLNGNTSTDEELFFGGKLYSEITYQSIELPVGLRHYVFLNEDSRIFVNLNYAVNWSNNSDITNTREGGSLINSLSIKPGGNLALGLGYKHNDRLGVEIKYQANRELFIDRVSWRGKFQTLSLILSYSFF